MKKKIYIYLLLVGIAAVLLTAVVQMGVFSAILEKENIHDLRIRCSLMTESYEQHHSIDDLKHLLPQENRLTVIDESGNVLYESLSEIGSDNHLNRPEVQTAISTGEGSSHRHSASVGYETFYYAMKADDGNIIRVSQDVKTERLLYQRLLLYGAFLIAAVLVLAMVLAHYLTKRIIEPIEKMAEDLDNIENYVPYPELSPFAHAVQTAQEQKKANEEQRREFTANVSHELKTPLTSIMGYSEMIETGLVKEEDVKIFAAKIHTEAERQLHLIGDIIQLSELDVEQSKENFVSVDLYTLAESVIEYLSFAAQKYQVSLSADGEHLQVLGNKNLLEELVYNLCDNAIRYNKPGGWVKISIYKHGERTALAVSDDGIGISPQDQARIFERFYRVDKSRSRDTGGTGLGLAIVKHIALQHEAQIFVKSLPDMGTTIEVIFKAEEEENEE